MPDVDFSRRALLTIYRIDSYLSERNPQAARNVLAEIERTCNLLGEFPLIGVAVPSTRLRSHVTRHYRYRIIYRVSARGIEIRDVLHPSRNR